MSRARSADEILVTAREEQPEGKAVSWPANPSRMLKHLRRYILRCRQQPTGFGQLQVSYLVPDLDGVQTSRASISCFGFVVESGFVTIG